MSRTIAIEHLGRVEGHGGVTVVLEGAEVTRVEFDIVEGLRLFEQLVLGRRWNEVPAIVSRVCAICAHAHAITAVMAVESALRVEVDAGVRKLRELAIQGGNVESHALHAFALALPDFVGVPGVVELAQRFPSAVALGLRLKKLGNTVQEVVGGRAVHPVTYVPGGFSAVPSREALALLREQLEEGLEDCARMVELWSGVPIPDPCDAPIRCAALVPEDDFFLHGRTIRMPDGTTVPVARYRELTNEYTVTHSNAKHSAYDGEAYLLGALARIEVNGLPAGSRAAAAAARLGLQVPSRNVMANTLAQVVEIVRSTERARDLVVELLETDLRHTPPAPIVPRAGEGVAAMEAPRGILFHRYELDASGVVVAADVITPTAQNLHDAEDRLRVAAGQGSGLPDPELTRRFEMICRAYDPCISCSVHVIRTAA